MGTDAVIRLAFNRYVECMLRGATWLYALWRVEVVGTRSIQWGKLELGNGLLKICIRDGDT